jgi:hypothetical protein
MTVENTLALLLVAAAAYRTWRLLAIDTVLDVPRDKLLSGRPRLDAFVGCPWCLGWWVTTGWMLAWWAWQDTVWVAAWWCATAIVGWVARND